MKKLIILAVVTTLYFNASAQKGFRIGGGLTVAIPVSNLDAYSIGVGFDILGQYGITSQFAVTGDVGYTTLFAKNKDAKALNIIPIRGGIRFYPTSQFYLAAKAGVGIVKTSGFSSQSNLAYAVGAGFKMDDKLDIGLSYEGYSYKYPSGYLFPPSGSSIGYIGIRLGYFFN